MINILVADDEERIRKLLKDFLKIEGYNILEAKDGQEAIDMVIENKDTINLVILDVMMPYIDGFSVLQRIRKINRNILVIMLTARDGENDEVFGFELGADDYISKPFSPVVLTARVKSILKRQSVHRNEENIIINNINIDVISRTVTVDGNRIELSPKEYEMLVYIARNPNIAISREQMLNVVWGYSYYGDSRTIDTHVKRLRSKLGTEGDCIKTVRGYGYRLEVNYEEKN